MGSYTTLTDFFKEYMFKGLVWTRDGERSFELEVFEYDPSKRLFVGAGRDDRRNLSAIVGKIEPQTTDLAVVRFKQVFDFRSPIPFDCKLEKTSDNVLVECSYAYPKDKKKNRYSVRLATALRPGKLLHMGWMDNALKVSFE